MRYRLFGRKCVDCNKLNRKSSYYCTNCGTYLRTSRELKPPRFLYIWPALLSLAIIGVYTLPIVYKEQMLRSANADFISRTAVAGINHYGQLIFASANPRYTHDILRDCEIKSSDDGFVEQGCYSFLNNAIYLAKPTAHFDGVQTVTEAHEMLHVAYIAEITSDFKGKLNKLLEAETKRNHPGLKEKLISYEKTEPGMRLNELHSILGTEYSDLSPELEKYYTKYFSNRKKVVALKEQIMRPINALQEKMTAIQTEIDAAKSTSDSLYAQSAAAGGRGDAAENEYYYGLYLEAMNRLQDKQKQYNSVVNEHNALADEFDGGRK